MERHPIELIRPLKPVITVVGLDGTMDADAQVEKILFSVLSSRFDFIFTPQYREAGLKRVPVTGLKSPLPAPLIGWVAKYTGVQGGGAEVPSVILDVQRAARGLEEAMAAGLEALRPAGIKYAVLLLVDSESAKSESALILRRLSFDQKSLVTPLDLADDDPLEALSRLQKTLEQLSSSFYKEKAKRCRKRASQKASSFPSAGGQQFWAPLVRYNFKAAWMEEAGGDLGAAGKSYHVAYSALVEQAKRLEDEGGGAMAAFIGQVRWIADILAVKVTSCHLRNGMASEGHGYLGDHFRWSRPSVEPSSVDPWMAKNGLAVAESLGLAGQPALADHTGYFYLHAALHLRSCLSPPLLGDLQEALTKAFDAYKLVARMRMLIYISFLSADAFGSGQNVELLARRLCNEDGWAGLAKLMLQRLDSGSVSFPSAWMLVAEDVEGNLDLLDRVIANSTDVAKLRFNRAGQAKMLSCAFRFMVREAFYGDDEVKAELLVSNMTPMILQLLSITLYFSSGDDEEIESVHHTVIQLGNKELVPGASEKIHLPIPLPSTRHNLRLTHLVLGTAERLEITFDADALHTNNSTSDITNAAFEHALRHYWPRCHSLVINRQPRVTATLGLASPLAASGAPAKLQLTLNNSGVKPLAGRIGIVNLDGGNLVSGQQQQTEIAIPVGETTPELFEVLWEGAGRKQVNLELHIGEATISVTQLIDVVQVLEFEYQAIPTANPASQSTELTALLSFTLFIDCTVKADQLTLCGWELWDAASGRQFPSLAPAAAQPAKAYGFGDRLRIAFPIDTSHSGVDPIDPVLRITWTADQIVKGASCFAIPAPLHPIPQGSPFFVIPRASKAQTAVGRPIECHWEIWSLTPRSSPHSVAVAIEEDGWVYGGPKHIEFTPKPGGVEHVRAWLMPTRPGITALPGLMLQAVIPGESVAFEGLRHPDILVLPSA